MIIYTNFLDTPKRERKCRWKGFNLECFSRNPLGSWYALEQCGRLLQSAVCVFDSADHATAVALAMLGKEEFTLQNNVPLSLVSPFRANHRVHLTD